MFPTLDLLKFYDSGNVEVNREELEENQQMIIFTQLRLIEFLLFFGHFHFENRVIAIAGLDNRIIPTGYLKFSMYICVL